MSIVAVPIAEIRARLAAYQANPDSTDAAADMAACCDSDLAAVLALYDALLADLAWLAHEMRDANEHEQRSMLDHWVGRLAAIRTAHPPREAQ